MAKAKSGSGAPTDQTGPAGEPHQHSAVPLTTNQGTPIADDQNTLRAGARGPSLIEDFHFLEKMTHLNHKRIPERVVHARGSAAHGTFVAYKGAAGGARAAGRRGGAGAPGGARGA